MNQEIRKEVLAILDRAVEILAVTEIRDIIELKQLSDKTLEASSLFQDHDSITVGVLIYALAKTFERDSEDVNHKLILKKVICARDSLKKNDLDTFRICTKELLDIIQKADYRFKHFVQHVLEKAKINKGSKLFARGISMARVAELLNISHWELMNYIGKTQISERDSPGVPIRARIRLTRSLIE